VIAAACGESLSFRQYILKEFSDKNVLYQLFHGIV